MSKSKRYPISITTIYTISCSTRPRFLLLDFRGGLRTGEVLAEGGADTLFLLELGEEVFFDLVGFAFLTPDFSAGDTTFFL